MTRTVAALALLALTLSACGGTEIEPGRAEQLIRDNLTGPPPTSVDCPSGVDAQKGETFECRIEYAGRPPARVTVHIDDGDGHVSVGPGDFKPGE